MPSLKENYSFWLMPSQSSKQELQEIINKLASRHDAISFEPHLTLGTVSTEVCDNPKRALKALHHQSAPLTLKSPKVTCGKLFTQSVYLRFEASTVLQAIYEKSCCVVQGSPHPFYPHLSLIYKNLSNDIQGEILMSITPLRDIVFDAIKVIKTPASVQTNADVQSWVTVCEQNL